MEPFPDVAFDLSNVLTTHSLTGTLLEGIFGYQETPSVSEVFAYFLYLIPALVLFFMPPRGFAAFQGLRRNPPLIACSGYNKLI